MLDVLWELGSPRSSDPFPLPVLERLSALLGVEAAEYGEFSLWDDGGNYSTDHATPTRGPAPEWLLVNLRRLWQQDPISCHIHAAATEPLAISDRIGQREFQRLELFQDVYRPFDTADCFRLYLPSPKGKSRFFRFDHGRWGLRERSRELLTLLRPHLVRHRQQWRPLPNDRLDTLTRREREVLEAISNGETNAQIGKRLWISPNTVGRHVEHIFEKLSVNTRTEAAAQLFAAPRN